LKSKLVLWEAGPRLDENVNKEKLRLLPKLQLSTMGKQHNNKQPSNDRRERKTSMLGL